ncbi:hypothetical protein ACFZC7_35330 [Streptomyces massasporeus]|uniref:hypothetical protein n=1 Tax=Streptomyces massasporeus TaxID=67324 RepID=UPI0036EA0D7E
MPKISRVGAVNIEHGYFPVGELWEPGFERKDHRLDLEAREPVIVVPGQIVVTSRVQEHAAPVVLAVVDRENEAPGPSWTRVASVEYRPVYRGRMAALDTMNGPSGPAADGLEVFGQRADPGDPFVDLAPAQVYRAQVWSQGRADSRERFDAATRREEGPARDGFETYLIVFVPWGTQSPPLPAARASRREHLVSKHGKPPLNMR